MRTTALGAAFAAALLLASACGDDDDAAVDTDAGAQDEETTTTSAPADGGDGGGDEEAATLAVASTSLGDVLVDADGMTVYLFTQDTGSTSTCEGDCAETWPAVTVEGDPVAGEGVDASLLGTTERPDGSTQLTYAGHPVYLFAGDSAPGDVNGQGVGGVWWVIAPDGTAVEEAALAGSPPGY